MSEEEWRAFLSRPVRPAVLSTVRSDGRPHAAPIWYDLESASHVWPLRAAGLVSLKVGPSYVDGSSFAASRSFGWRSTVIDRRVVNQLGQREVKRRWLPDPKG